MKGDLAVGVGRFDPPATEARAEALVDRILVPHPDEQVVGYVPLRPDTTCECRHGIEAAATVRVKMGRSTTNPARVCPATLERIRSIFPASELIVDSPPNRCCPYEPAAHVDGACPDEATAVAVWGRS